MSDSKKLTFVEQLSHYVKNLDHFVDQVVRCEHNLDSFHDYDYDGGIRIQINNTCDSVTVPGSYHYMVSGILDACKGAYLKQIKESYNQIFSLIEEEEKLQKKEIGDVIAGSDTE